jgi:hypothetical protein
VQRSLEGVRVLDLSRLLPGPFLTMVLADLGADVVKIEDPKVGDYLRVFPPTKGGVGRALPSRSIAASAPWPSTSSSRRTTPRSCGWSRAPTWWSRASAPG